jgi:methyl-accepting chemotaxis protein
MNNHSPAIKNDYEQAQSEMLARWLETAGVYHHATKVLRYKLPQTASLVEDSVKQMSSLFVGLSSGLKEQSGAIREISALANTLDLGNEKITMEEFTKLFSETLSDSISKILFVSKRAITMVYLLDEAMKNIASIEHFITDIRNITKKANMLALNASIEAARAGEKGEGFSVVANEVKQVSETIRQIADSINERIGIVSKSVKDGYDVLKDVATTDMSENMMAQDKLTSLMESLLKQKDNFATVLQHSAGASDEISNTISGMVMNLQFQDRTSQYVASSVRLLEFMDTAMSDLKAENERNFPELANIEPRIELVDEVASQLTLSEFVKLFRLSIAGIDLEVETEHHEEIKKENNLHEEEDIELF